MKFINKHKGKLFILIFVIFTLYTIFDTYSFSNQTEAKEKTKTVTKKEKTENTEEKEKIENVLVDVKGEVKTPGVYELTSESTVMDAINKAGGLTNKSDTSNINLSKKLEDEMVIIVYSQSEIKEMKEKDQIVCPPCNNACVTEEDEKAKLDEESKDSSAQVTANVMIKPGDETAFKTQYGIVEAKSKAIIEYRNKNGNFKTIEDIKNVSGIGDSVYEKIKDNITV